MKRFAQSDIRAAYAHAAAGGQALHVCNSRQFVTKEAPHCFRISSTFAHLIDNDRARLERTARRLGVRVVVVERAGEVGQHVDLCGRPLVKALELAAAAEAAPELPLARHCPNDTNGDGDCQLCHARGGCTYQDFTNVRLGEPWK